ncbi:MAG: ActS/PrrB/RegB family redox-sensitive histidine kinase [Pseudomonadota bacterium]
MAERSSTQRLRFRTLVMMRWAAVLGQGAALVFVHLGLGFDMAFIPAMMVVILAGAVNVALSMSRPSSAWLSEKGAVWALAFDICQLGALLGLTGGLQNPFVILLLAPLAISAWSLTLKSTLAIVGLEIAVVSVLGVYCLPLPWLPGGMAFPPLYLAAVWVALVVAILFTAFFVAFVSQEKGRLGDALSVTQQALAREQRMAALGGVAAAAAHQLGTPLGTVTLVARELQRDLPADHPWREDMDLMVEELARCREILSGLERKPAEDDGSAFRRLSLTSLVELAAEPYLIESIEFRITGPTSGQGVPEIVSEVDPEPQFERHPEIIHGLGTLLQNAFQFARSRVLARLEWEKEQVSITIHDDGPGFDVTRMSRLGEPFFSTGERDCRKNGDHMGLGIFIARSLLSHHGAQVSFMNSPSGGAQARITWVQENKAEKGQSQNG